ncbi:hypothetical protein KSP40_PGU004176 [Platanthera guangdongensis]|uniref:Conserved oligomeric Golgi complex subunit 2 n=1 Tax=Platanthera guangdongensis TaxID=2320717 RepID=A0ABR2MFI5_9ASPA
MAVMTATLTMEATTKMTATVVTTTTASRGARTCHAPSPQHYFAWFSDFFLESPPIFPQILHRIPRPAPENSSLETVDLLLRPTSRINAFFDSLLGLTSCDLWCRGLPVFYQRLLIQVLLPNTAASHRSTLLKPARSFCSCQRRCEGLLPFHAKNELGVVSAQSIAENKSQHERDFRTYIKRNKMPLYPHGRPIPYSATSSSLRSPRLLFLPSTTIFPPPILSVAMVELHPPSVLPRSAIELFGDPSGDADPLWFKKSSFLREDFDAESYIADLRTFVPLESLGAELRSHLSILKSELVELINRDYADFVSLSTRLVDVDSSIARMRAPLVDFRDKVGAFRAAVENSLSSLRGGLHQRAEASAAREILERLLDTFHVVSKKVEKLIKDLPTTLSIESSTDLVHLEKGILSNENSLQPAENGNNLRVTQSILLERIASEMNRIKFSISNAKRRYAQLLELRIDMTRSRFRAVYHRKGPRITETESSAWSGVIEASEEDEGKLLRLYLFGRFSSPFWANAAGRRVNLSRSDGALNLWAGLEGTIAAEVGNGIAEAGDKETSASNNTNDGVATVIDVDNDDGVDAGNDTAVTLRIMLTMAPVSANDDACVSEYGTAVEEAE